MHVLDCAVNSVNRFENLLDLCLVWFKIRIALLRRLFWLLFFQLQPEAFQLQLILTHFFYQLQWLLRTLINLPLKGLDRAAILLLAKNVHFLFFNQVPLDSLRVLRQLTVLPPYFIVLYGPILAVHLDSQVFILYRAMTHICLGC